MFPVNVPVRIFREAEWNIQRDLYWKESRSQQKKYPEIPVIEYAFFRKHFIENIRQAERKQEQQVSWNKTESCTFFMPDLIIEIKMIIQKDEKSG